MPAAWGDDAKYREYLEQHKDQDPNSPDILNAKNKLADALITYRRNCSEAESILRDILPSVRKQYGEHSPKSIGCYRDLIRAVECQFRQPECTQMIGEARKQISGMKRAGYGDKQRLETQLLDKVEADMKGMQADMDERFEFMDTLFKTGKK